MERLDWEDQVDYFQKVRGRLLKDKKYRDKFIAIRHRRVIASGIDQFELSRRLSSKFPEDVVLIVKVQKEFPLVEIPQDPSLHRPRAFFSAGGHLRAQESRPDRKRPADPDRFVCQRAGRVL
jgi:hypothetical protein